MQNANVWCSVCVWENVKGWGKQKTKRAGNGKMWANKQGNKKATNEIVAHSNKTTNKSKHVVKCKCVCAQVSQPSLGRFHPPPKKKGN